MRIVMPCVSHLRALDQAPIVLESDNYKHIFSEFSSDANPAVQPIAQSGNDYGPEGVSDYSLMELARILHSRQGQSLAPGTQPDSVRPSSKGTERALRRNRCRRKGGVTPDIDHVAHKRDVWGKQVNLETSGRADSDVVFEDNGLLAKASPLIQLEQPVVQDEVIS